MENDTKHVFIHVPDTDSYKFQVKPPKFQPFACPKPTIGYTPIVRNTSFSANRTIDFTSSEKITDPANFDVTLKDGEDLT